MLSGVGLEVLLRNRLALVAWSHVELLLRVALLREIGLGNLRILLELLGRGLEERLHETCLLKLPVVVFDTRDKAADAHT